MALGPLLKHGWLFEGQILSGEYTPGAMGAHQRDRLPEVVLVVGPEVEVRALLGPRGDGFEELRFHDPVLVVAPLRPRIGEEHVHLGKVRPVGHRRQEVFRVSQEKMKVFETRAVQFSIRARNPV
jgi:hypothetical protein